MARIGKLNRRVGNMPEGTTVYKFDFYTYGCITGKGVAVSDKPDKIPFYEIPKDSVKWE